jgi:hypothetical protein
MDADHPDRTRALLDHYLRACRDDAAVIVGNDDRTDRGEVDGVAVDAGPQRDYVKITIKIAVPHSE